MRWLDECRGRVAVVGNGPLSEKDRTRINTDASFECVVRFNDARSALDETDRTDVLATRLLVAEDGEVRRFTINEDRAYTPASSRDRVVVLPILPVSAHTDDHKKLWDPLGRVGRVSQPLYVYERAAAAAAPLPSEDTLFPTCAACHQGHFQCDHASAKYGPSSGAAVVDALDADPDVETIDIFGMNWSPDSPHQRQWHVDFRAPDLVPQCCEKCTIHSTSTNAYRAITSGDL